MASSEQEAAMTVRAWLLNGEQEPCAGTISAMWTLVSAIVPHADFPLYEMPAGELLLVSLKDMPLLLAKRDGDFVYLPHCKLRKWRVDDVLVWCRVDDTPKDAITEEALSLVMLNDDSLHFALRVDDAVWITGDGRKLKDHQVVRRMRLRSPPKGAFFR